MPMKKKLNHLKDYDEITHLVSPIPAVDDDRYPTPRKFRHAIISPNLVWPNTVLSTVSVNLFDGVERVCLTPFVFN